MLPATTGPGVGRRRVAGRGDSEYSSTRGSGLGRRFSELKSAVYQSVYQKKQTL